jgi:hypothetical protein
MMQSIQEITAHQNSLFYQYDWPGVLTARTYERLDPRSTSIDPKVLIRAAQVTYATIFSTHFTFWRDTYLDRLPQPHSILVDGTETNGIWGLLPSTPSIVIVIALITLDIVVIVAVFVARRRRFNAPRIPKTIGSIIPWIAHSRMMRDFVGTYQWTDAEQERHLEKLGQKYSFGTFLCSDGVSRLALDYNSTHSEEEYKVHDKEATATSCIATSECTSKGSQTNEGVVDHTL